MITDIFFDFSNWRSEADKEFLLRVNTYFWMQYPIPYMDIYAIQSKYWTASKRYQTVGSTAKQTKE